MTAAADKGRLEHTALAAPQEVGQLLSCSVASRLDRRALVVVVVVGGGGGRRRRRRYCRRRFYIGLFRPALEQTHCVLVACDSE